jgi:hypothetical protein
MESIAAKIPNIRSLKITGEEDEFLDFSFLRLFPNLETFHFNRTRMGGLTSNQAPYFCSLKRLIEIDLNATLIYTESMLSLLGSLPETLRRFRHLSDAAMKHFSFIVKRFPKLEQFAIVGAHQQRTRVSSRSSLLSP